MLIGFFLVTVCGPAKAQMKDARSPSDNILVRLFNQAFSHGLASNRPIKIDLTEEARRLTGNMSPAEFRRELVQLLPTFDTPTNFAIDQQHAFSISARILERLRGPNHPPLGFRANDEFWIIYVTGQSHVRVVETYVLNKDVFP